MSEHSKKTIKPENLRRAFEKMGLGNWGIQATVAEKLGVSSQAVNRWLMPNIDTQPTIDKLIKIAELANMSLDELILGEDSALWIPLLNNFTDAVAFCKGEKVPSKDKIPVIGGGLKQGFAVRLNDESMSPNIGKSYPPNSLLVFDMSKQTPQHESYVFATIKGDNEEIGVFRRFVKVGKTEQLIALNPLYPKIDSDFTIAATLVYAVLD
ncbi:MAG: LexA family transcriptional regulator [Neisseriaceae bacterium]|nr:LexA family transcriptional regulator [Neisseriaceae bacterium]MBQ9183745.1 LexA family transcriptional regulator [Neisseriaceae bacterium]MBQ9618974.1 LexA family transcriptional regulator [Neisseriaceae bacterium]MBQ9724045.1 LexA family transcriptional regulator [Neisseriaceae bacterium]MBR5941371.1 LexA family transcriptional regulator [Neisseriaceae bacterium]